MKDAIGIADLAALVTVAGVSVYVAGLLGLALAIRLRLTDDIGTAWYAVSLLPRTDVAGQGVGIWLRWPLPIAVVIVVLDTLGEDIGAFDTAKFDPLISLSGLVVLGLFAVQILRRLDYEKVTERQSHTLSHSHALKNGFYIAAIVTAAAGSLLMSIGALRVVQGAREATLPVLQALTHGVFSGTIFFLVGGLFVGVAGAAVLDNPLPHVLIEPDPTAVNLPALKGSELYLVTHAEGHWHVLDDDSNALLFVPDRLVWSVHTYKKIPSKKPAVKKGGEQRKWWQRIVEFFGYHSGGRA